MVPFSDHTLEPVADVEPWISMVLFADHSLEPVADVEP